MSAPLIVLDENIDFSASKFMSNIEPIQLFSIDPVSSGNVTMDITEDSQILENQVGNIDLGEVCNHVYKQLDLL